MEPITLSPAFWFALGKRPAEQRHVAFMFSEIINLSKSLQHSGIFMELQREIKYAVHDHWIDLIAVLVQPHQVIDIKKVHNMTLYTSKLTTQSLLLKKRNLMLMLYIMYLLNLTITNR